MVNAHPFRIAVAILLSAASGLAARADVIMDWNARADAISTEKRMAPPPTARLMALVHVAMFEALNAIERRYQPYRLDLVADRNTSREAAAASAAYTVLVAQFPDQKAALEAELARELGHDRGSAGQGARHSRRAQGGDRSARAACRRGQGRRRLPPLHPGGYVRAHSSRGGVSTCGPTSRGS